MDNYSINNIDHILYTQVSYKETMMMKGEKGCSIVRSGEKRHGPLNHPL